MAIHTETIRRVALAGGLALAVCAPVTAALTGFSSESATTPVAACPANEVFDPIGGGCKPVTDQAPQTFSPINPENEALQPGSITSSEAGEVGRLPEVNGIPCNGDNTGLCIGLTEQNNMLEGHPANPNLTSP